MDTKQLRINGYLVSGQVIECHREGERSEQGRTAIIKIDGSREFVDQLLAVVDSPRALVGRSREGSTIVLFRRDGMRNFVPEVVGYRDGIFDLVLNSNGEPLLLTFGSEGHCVDPSAWTWPKGRSPADVSRDMLPNITGDLCDAVAREALNHCRDGKLAREEAEQAKAFEKRRAAFIAEQERPRTPAELQAIEDAELVKQFDGVIFAWDDADKERVEAARNREERRQAKRQSAAAA